MRLEPAISLLKHTTCEITSPLYRGHVCFCHNTLSIAHQAQKRYGQMGAPEDCVRPTEVSEGGLAIRRARGCQQLFAHRLQPRPVVPQPLPHQPVEAELNKMHSNYFFKTLMPRADKPLTLPSIHSVLC